MRHTYPVHKRSPRKQRACGHKVMVEYLMGPVLVVNAKSILIRRGRVHACDNGHVEVNFIYYRRVTGRHVTMRRVVVNNSSMVVEGFLRDPRVFFIKLRILVRPASFRVVPRRITRHLKRVNFAVQGVQFTRPRRSFIQRRFLHGRQAGHRIRNVSAYEV